MFRIHSPESALPRVLLLLGSLGLACLRAQEVGPNGPAGPSGGRPPGPVLGSPGSGPGLPRPGMRPRLGAGLQAGEPEPPQPFVLERIVSRYRPAPEAAPGEFRTGQEADVVLAWPGFELDGATVEFGHPSSLATDGRSLAVADRWNNRVLYWRRAPASNTPPDRVFGQPDLRRIDSGPDRNQLASPAGVAMDADGRILAVSDMRNDRVLIWKGIPDVDGAPADVRIDLPLLTSRIQPDVPLWVPSGPGLPEPGQGRGPMGPLPRFGPRAPLGWPAGVWTDGRRLAVVATRGACVLVWNAIPTSDNPTPDLVLVPADARNPRVISSDGKSWFALTDFQLGPTPRIRTFVWNSFPTNRHQLPDFDLPGWRQGAFLSDGRLALGREDGVEIWNRPPTSRRDPPAVRIESPAIRSFMSGDAVVAAGRLYATSANRLQVAAWSEVPATPREPDFVLGAGSVARNGWVEGHRLHDPILASDGKSLFAASGRDRKLFIWLRLPDESGAPPDRILHLPASPTDMAVFGSRLVMSTPRAVYLWPNLPLEGGEPEVVVKDLGPRDTVSDFAGVAMDSRRFYVADRAAGAIHVWDGIPTAGRDPDTALILPGPGRLSADGERLFVASSFDEPPVFWRVGELDVGSDPNPIGIAGFLRLSAQVATGGGHLFVANRSNHRIDVWNAAEAALAGRPPSGYLGVRGEADPTPLPARRALTHPASMVWAGGYLWVAESRFGSRILRFRPH